MTPEEFGQRYYEWYMQNHVTSLSGPLFFASVGVLKVWNEVHARSAIGPNTFAEIYRRAVRSYSCRALRHAFSSQVEVMTPEEFGQGYYKWYMQKHVPPLNERLHAAPKKVMTAWKTIHGKHEVQPARFAEIYRQSHINTDMTELLALLMAHRLES